MSWLLSDHFFLLTLLAALISAFLALLWRESRREVVRFFVRTFLLLVGASVATAWILRLIPER